MAENGLVGKISHGATQVIKAPNPGPGGRKSGTVKTGNDLRTGK